MTAVREAALALPAMPAVDFDAATHTYTVRGRRLPSVTELVKSVSAPFDAQAAAERVAARRSAAYGRQVAAGEVLAEWEEAGRRARESGRATHEAIERVLGGSGGADGTAEFRAWSAWWASGPSSSLSVVAKEEAVADEALGVAGRLDALLASAKTGVAHVFDWKTGKRYEFASRYGDKMLAPFSDLDDCEHSRYSLQASVYRLVLERAGLACGESWVVRLPASGPAAAYRAADLRARAEAWLAGREDARRAIEK